MRPIQWNSYGFQQIENIMFKKECAASTLEKHVVIYTNW